MILDPAIWAVDPPHQVYSPLTLRQFLAFDLSNRALGPTFKDKKAKADLKTLDLAVRQLEEA